MAERKIKLIKIKCFGCCLLMSFYWMLFDICCAHTSIHAIISSKIWLKPFVQWYTANAWIAVRKSKCIGCKITYHFYAFFIKPDGASCAALDHIVFRSLPILYHSLAECSGIWNRIFPQNARKNLPRLLSRACVRFIRILCAGGNILS